MFFATNLYGIYSLRVGDPRFSWSTYQGTIEEATLSVKPKGLYLEYGLYLTFSARGTNFDANDSLEVVLKFDLPAAAIVHDSWLWIGDDIVRAKILDKWSATTIYEGIVKRRQDPSILYKQSATQYELRVFPMAGNETRRVKLTFLMPTNWTQREVLAFLPTQIVKTSRFAVAQLPILAWEDEDWQHPSIVQHPEIVFT